MHQLRVLSAAGVTLHTEQVVIRDAGQPLSIRIEAPASANRAMGGGGGSTVSLRQLTHKVPPSAQSAFTKGERDALKGNYKEAAELFKQAIALDPEFADAYNELAAAEASLGDLSKSADDFQKAVDLDPEHRYALPNLAIVLAKLSRFPEAGDVARRALKVVPGSGKLHYILAVSMMEENGDFDEIIRHLGRATEEVPRAHLVAADLLIQKGRRDDAVRHLEDYLIAAKPDDEYRPKVQARLIELQH